MVLHAIVASAAKIRRLCKDTAHVKAAGIMSVSQDYVKPSELKLLAAEQSENHTEAREIEVQDTSFRRFEMHEVVAFHSSGVFCLRDERGGYY